MMLGIGQYTLRHGKVKPEPDSLKWGRWFHSTCHGKQRRPGNGRTLLRSRTYHGVEVSTVFLALDHNYGPPEDGPVLWETMIFGGELNHELHRYRSEEEARAGHALMVEIAEAAQNVKRRRGRLAKKIRKMRQNMGKRIASPN